MGVVFGWEDRLKGRRRTLREGLRDLSPGVADSIFRILDAWREGESEEEIRRLVGEEKAEEILRLLRKLGR